MHPLSTVAFSSSGAPNINAKHSILAKIWGNYKLAKRKEGMGYGGGRMEKILIEYLLF